MTWLGEQYGNIASVVGLVVSAATLLVAARTRARIESAKEELLSRVNSAETLRSVASIETTLAELLIYCDAMDWAFAVDRCAAALRFMQILKRSDCVPAGELMMIRRRIDDLRESRVRLKQSANGTISTDLKEGNCG